MASWAQHPIRDRLRIRYIIFIYWFNDIYCRCLGAHLVVLNSLKIQKLISSNFDLQNVSLQSFWHRQVLLLQCDPRRTKKERRSCTSFLSIKQYIKNAKRNQSPPLTTLGFAGLLHYLKKWTLSYHSAEEDGSLVFRKRDSTKASGPQSLRAYLFRSSSSLRTWHGTTGKPWNTNSI